MLRRTVEAVHVLHFKFSTNVWYEYVRSADNWSDGISRRGWQDETVAALSRRFHTRRQALRQSSWWWEVDLQEIWDLSADR